MPRSKMDKNKQNLSNNDIVQQYLLMQMEYKISNTIKINKDIENNISGKEPKN
jgi:hypothetical protein